MISSEMLSVGKW